MFGVKTPDRPSKELALLKGFRVRGEDVSEDSIRNTLVNVAEFSPDAYIWIKKSILIDNKDALEKIALLPEIENRQGELGKPEYAELSLELKRSGQEFYDMRVIRKKTQ